jgi:hypothetical protein
MADECRSPPGEAFAGIAEKAALTEKPQLRDYSCQSARSDQDAGGAAAGGRHIAVSGGAPSGISGFPVG